jgi:bacterioferritin
MLTYAEPNSDAQVTDPVGPRSALVRHLTDAYWGEIQTVSAYVMSSTNRGGIRASRIAGSLREMIACNLDHAQRLAIRIKQLHGPAPGPAGFATRALRLRPPEDALDHFSALSGVIEAETAAIKRYRRIVATLDPADWVTRELLIELIREKRALRQQLESHLVESDKLGDDSPLSAGG